MYSYSYMAIQDIAGGGWGGKPRTLTMKVTCKSQNTIRTQSS